MKTFLTFIFVVFLTACGGGGGSINRTILLGDSLSAGQGQCLGYTPCPVVPVGDEILQMFGGGENLAAAGETTQHALGKDLSVLDPIYWDATNRKFDNVFSLVKQEPIDTLILRYCVADIVKGLNSDIVFQNVKEIIQSINARHTVVIKCSPILLNQRTKDEYTKLNNLFDTLQNVKVISVGDQTTPMEDLYHPDRELVVHQLKMIQSQL